MNSPPHGLVAGFTGTRHGLSSFQRQNLGRLLMTAAPRRGHHGDCLGADAEFHMLCEALGIPVTVHPPDSEKLRAFCSGEVVLPPLPYLVRDLDIVVSSDYLIACPADYSRQRGSGTWATVAYARRYDIPVWLLFPDGTIRVDRDGASG